MRYIFLFISFILLMGCGTSPGRLKKLKGYDISYPRNPVPIKVSGLAKSQISVQYLGSGGLYITKGGEGILIDPFFSNQKLGRLGASFIGGGFKGRKKLSSDQKMILFGLKRIEDNFGSIQGKVKAVFSAHSHYDHLMDVPSIFDRLGKSVPVYLNRSGFNTCYYMIDNTKMEILEDHMTTQEVIRPPIELNTSSGKIHVYPILAEHNPHFKYIKTYSGSHTRPVKDFNKESPKTRGNDWLEGNTFSFLIDYLNAEGSIDLRIFVQSSSCNPPAGIPPVELMKSRDVDIAFLGVASYHFSPDYPCTLLDSIRPEKVVWIHWEDFFRRYTKKPKTVRGTDVARFFELPCLKPYPENFLPWPGVVFDVGY